jgi:hypothetical protein
MTVTGFDHLERELSAGVRRRHHRARRPWRRPITLSFAAALLVTGGALAATGVIPIGSPVPTSHDRSSLDRDTGVVLPGTAKVLSLRAADPGGGPDWAMRVQATTRAAVCIQAARVAHGRLGVLGQDGAFGDDGRFHPLAAQSGSPACGALDANGDTSFNVSADAVPASGAAGGLLGIDVPGCGRPGAKPCPSRDLRDVSYGVLGREAASVTYEGDDGKLHTVRALPPYGAYLIVRRSASIGRGTSRGPAIGSGPNPAGGPIRKITFRNGRSCTFPKPGPGARYRPCALPGLRPAAPAYTHAQLATPVRARPYLRRGRYWTISVSFRARAAITTAGQAYVILLRHPRARYGVSLIGFTRHDIAAGTVVTKRTVYSTPSGRYTGEVRLLSTATPGAFAFRPGAGTLVGRFDVRVP